MLGNIAGTSRTPANTNLQAAGAGGVTMYDASGPMPRRLSAADANGSTDAILGTAYENAVKTDAFFRNQFGRNGWDNKGSALEIVVHAPDPDTGDVMNNAYWDPRERKIFLGDGDGRLLAPLGNSYDVMVHEAVHAMVDSEVNLKYVGQQGAINESFADVLACLADDDWTIGEDVLTPNVAGDALRDLSKPRFDHVSNVPSGMDEVHDLSGIPSLAAVRAAKEIGKNEMGNIWYRALTQHLDSRSGFSGAARATLEATVELHGADSKQFSAVMDAWKSVGVDPRFKLESTPAPSVAQAKAGATSTK